MLDYHIVFPHLEEHPWLPDIFDALPDLRWESMISGSFDRLGTIHPTAVLAERVSVGEGSTIGAYVVIENDVLIGKHCDIRPHAYIRSGTVISDGCVIGHSAEIKHAFLCSGVKVQGLCFVGDSILGKGCRIGTGTIISNRRFDQKPIAWRGPDGLIQTAQEKVGALIGDFARLGAHVTTNPGIIVGAYTWVSSGNVVSGFIDEERFITQDGRNVPNEEALDLADEDSVGKR